MFVNFAKEQSDEDNLTEVVVGTRTVHTNLTAPSTRINTPAIQQQTNPVAPPHPSKIAQQCGKSDSKEGKSKKAKASKDKSKDGKANGDTRSSMAMAGIPRADRTSRRDSSGSDSSNGKCQGESSRSKHTCKDPSALFIVSSNTQDSAL